MARLDAGQRLRRLLAVLAWLARRGRAPVAELAERFGLGPDELIGDLELAACCGLPPYSPDQLMEILVGEDEVVAHLGAELARPRRLTPAEGFALAASAQAIAAVPGADPDGVLASALAKLQTVLGERGRLQVDVPEPPALAAARQALGEHRRLHLRYLSASRDELTDRDVDPQAVVFTDGHWYLDGHCHRAGGLRRFRVDRIVDAAVTDQPAAAEPPAADEDGAGPREPFVAGPDTVTVTVAVDPSAAWVADAVPTLDRHHRDDGRLQLTLAVASTIWFGRLLLQLGPAAEVLHPPELAHAGVEAARRVLARYHPPGSAGAPSSAG